LLKKSYILLFLIMFLYSFFACPKKEYPQEKTFWRIAASLAGHMLAGTIRTRFAQTASRSNLLSCTRLGCDTRDLKPKQKII